MRPCVKTECEGKWALILQGLGYPAHIFNGRHQPCPYCAGRDRFRWDKNKEFSICNQCGFHTAMDMAMHQLNMTFQETANYIRPGVVKMEAVKTNEPDLEKRKERLKVILKGCKRIAEDTVAARYFAGRCITEVPDADCFYHPALDYFDSENKRQGAHPAIVSRIRTAEGEISSFQLLYLTHDGMKLNTPSYRKILPVIAPMKGGAIRLYEATDILYIAEGLESAMSARIDTGMPVWCAVNAGNLENVVIPDSVRHIYIVADMDESGTGLQSASTLYRKLLISRKRETVNIVIFHEHKQIIIKPEDYDYNDYLIQQSVA